MTDTSSEFDSNSEEEWEPIIDDISVAHPTLKVTFDGYNLYVNNEIYSDDVSRYLSCGPALTSTGRVSKRQPPPPPKQAATWWEAQCAFRGLTATGTIAQLQERIRGHEKDPITKALVELKAQAKRDFRTKNNAAVGDEWQHSLSDESKALTDPRRYLTETFAAGGAQKGTDLVVLKGDICDGITSPSWIQTLAKDLGLESEVVQAPEDKTLFLCDPRRKWVVVGRNQDAVADKARLIIQVREHQQDEKRQRRAAKEKEKLLQEKKRVDKLNASLDNCEPWDVTGTYTITCPSITDDYGGKGNLSLEIYWKPTAKGPQMFAKFNLGVVTGVIRFERQAPDAKSAPTHAVQNKKRKRQDVVDYESSSDSDYDRYGERRRSLTPEAFYLGSISKPSADYPTWNFRWRGEETNGERGIQLGSDEKLYDMTFFGPRVERLQGSFSCDFVSNCKFVGVRTSVGNGLTALNITEEWADRNERAKDREYGGW